jgi:hypothetical protein
LSIISSAHFFTYEFQERLRKYIRTLLRKKSYIGRNLLNLAKGRLVNLLFLAEAQEKMSSKTKELFKYGLHSIWDLLLAP